MGPAAPAIRSRITPGKSAVEGRRLTIIPEEFAAAREVLDLHVNIEEHLILPGISLADEIGTSPDAGLPRLVYAEARRSERSPHPDSTDLYFQGMAGVTSDISKHTDVSENR
jgi:hypothetical protein